MYTFRFISSDVNKKLIRLLEKKASGKYTVDKNQVVHYSKNDVDLIENEIISSIRSEVFPKWKVLTFPKEWTNSYREYMILHCIPFDEELNDGILQFLIERNRRPLSWKLKEPI